VSIAVPSEASSDAPFLTGRVVEQTGRMVGSYVGYFERTQATVAPSTVQYLRERLKDGVRFGELSTRLESLQAILARLAPSAAPVGQESLAPETIRDRIERARAAGGFENTPTLFLASWAREGVEVPSLFEGRLAPIVRLLEDPPRLRPTGFSLAGRGRLSEIVEGQLRRVTVPGSRLLELWRDGCLVAILPGGDLHLCWGMNSTPQTGLKINNFALAETTYILATLALRVCEFTEPRPVMLNFQLGLENMTWHDRRCSLDAAEIPNRIWFGDSRPAPGYRASFCVQVPVEGSNAGVISIWAASEALRLVRVRRGFNPLR
jgi:hypothetical protein